MLDAAFFDAADELFGKPTFHDVGEGELEDDLWLYEYRPRRRSEDKGSID